MRRISKWTIGCASAALLVLAACGGNDADNNGTVTGTGGAAGSGGGGTGGTGGGGSGGAGGGGGTTGAPAPQQLPPDQLALVILDGNADEVGDGGLGLARAQNADVLAFSQRMITDHTMGLQQGRQMTAAAKITPAQGTVGQQISVQSVGEEQQIRLQPLSRFDAAFMCMEIRTHQQLIAMLQAQTSPGPLAGMVQMNIQVATQHLQLAQQILATLSNNQVPAGSDATAYCAQFSGNGAATGATGG
jgi:predicted outer membrane protein